MGTVGRHWSRQVRNTETGEIYENVKEAAKAFGVSETAIYRRLNGKHKYRLDAKIKIMWVN